MKHFFIHFLLLITSLSYAQDQVIKTSKEIILCKVQRVAKLEIWYKKKDNPTGPEYAIDKTEVFMIVYKNGTIDKFDENKFEEKEISKEESSPIEKSIITTDTEKGETTEETGTLKIGKITIIKPKKEVLKQYKPVIENLQNVINKYLEEDDNGNFLINQITNSGFSLIGNGKIIGGFGDYFEFDNLLIEYINSDPVEIWIKCKNTYTYNEIKQVLEFQKINYSTPPVEKNAFVITTLSSTNKFNNAVSKGARFEMIEIESKKNTKEGYSRAIQLLEPFKDTISAMWRFKLGSYYFNINDIENCILNYSAASQMGYGEANYAMGIFYYEGLYVKKNYEKAINFFKLINEENSNYILVNYYLAVCGDKGYDGASTPDYEKIVNYYTKAANGGNIASMNALGELYFRGSKVRKNWTEAKKWFEKACTLQSKSACDYEDFIIKAEKKMQ